MKHLALITSLFLFFSCDNELLNSKTGSSDDAEAGFNSGDSQLNNNTKGPVYKSPNSSASADGVDMQLPDSITMQPLPDNKEDMKKLPHMKNNIDLKKLLPQLFAMANKLLPMNFFAPPNGEAIPPGPGKKCDPYHKMFQDDKEDDAVFKKWHNEKITFTCKSEEQEDGFYGYISAHLKSMKVDADQANSSPDGCVYPRHRSAFGTQMIKCKEFAIDLPSLKDGEYYLKAFFVSADKKNHFHGKADPAIEIKDKKIVNDAKIVMKKHELDSSGSVEVVFE